MAAWKPKIADGSGPIYERLISALQQDVRAGRLAPGERLPPHRDLAHRLGLGVGTVSRAYVEAERRGLVSSHVGRGTFIADRAAADAVRDEPGEIDMAHNVPSTVTARHWIGEALNRLRHRPEIAEAVAYAPAEGHATVRRAGASWLQRRHGVAQASADRLIQTNGGQHGLALAFGALARPGDTILCEAATYPGIRTLADHACYALRGVAMDTRSRRMWWTQANAPSLRSAASTPAP